MDNYKNPKARDSQSDFVHSFVDHSRKAREPFEEIWQETEANFLVRPLHEHRLVRSTQYPIQDSMASIRQPGRPNWSTLKDPETHQSVMTIVSAIVLASMSEPGFIKAKKVGGEDVLAASTVTKLLEYDLTLQGSFYSMVEWLMGAAIHGTGIVELNWHFEEAIRTFRNTSFDSEGNPISTSEELLVPIYDDPRFECVSPWDFFPDASCVSLARCMGAAKRFRRTKAQLLSDPNLDQAKVKEACAGPSVDSMESTDHPRDEVGGRQIKEAHPDYQQVSGLVFYGTVPYDPPDGIKQRIITTVNGIAVRDDPWPRRIPFYDVRINPRLGSFWGFSPAEGMRWDQDFADTMKMMLADATVRATHPPHIYNRMAGVDLAKLRRFSPEVPIGIDGDPSNIQQAQYSPPLAPAFNMYAGTKEGMRQMSGALGALQGLGLGSKRFTANEAVKTFENAMSRPELWVQVFEREYLPEIGKSLLALNQEFLEFGTDDLQRRVGETAFPVDLDTILADFDIRFVGSRQSVNAADKIAAFREISQAGATNPIIQQAVPWLPLIQKWFNDMGAEEIAAMIGNPQIMQLHMMLQQFAGPMPGAGNGNGEVAQGMPQGMTPIQEEGGVLPS